MNIKEGGIRRAPFALLALAATNCGAAIAGAGAEAGPYDLNAQLLAARGGETIVLADANYGNVTIGNKQFANSVTIDASKARFTGLALRRVSGLTIRGGQVISPRETQQVVVVDFASKVELRGMHIGGGRVAVTVARSTDVALVGNDFSGTRSDGVNVAMSQRVTIDGNRCVDFDPTPAEYAPDGKLIRDGDHPDCIQIWSAPGFPATSDLTIVNNVAIGFMQGIFVANPNGGVEQRPFERVIVKDNRLEVSAFNGILLINANNAVVTGNVVNTVPGSRLGAYPYPPIRAWLRVSGEFNRICGNVVGAWPDDVSTGRC